MPLHTQKHVKPRLLDQVRQTIRRKHYSLRTEATYIGWIKRYSSFIANGTRRKWVQPKWNSS
jgi:hypothetical protein